MNHTELWVICTLKCKKWTNVRIRLNMEYIYALMWKMQWTLRGNCGVSSSTVPSPAMTRCRSQPCLSSFSSWPWFSTWAVSFTPSKRSANSFYPSGWSPAPASQIFRKTHTETCRVDHLHPPGGWRQKTRLVQKKINCDLTSQVLKKCEDFRLIFN